MGYSRWDDKSWSAYSSTKTKGKSTSAIFTSSRLHPEFDPSKITIRESRDSDLNPKSNAIIIALDVSGSMGILADAMIREGLNILLTEIYARKPVEDPHVMLMGIDDVEVGDEVPLQVTQFEADIKLAEQLQKIFLEHGGGGNHYESYALAWYFAATRTSIDCFEKRGQKGVLFTIGDEEPTPYLRANDIKKVMGTGPQTDLNSEELLTMVRRQYDVYHIMVEQGNHFRSYGDRVTKKWRDILGQNAILLPDHTKISETIVSILQLRSGKDKDEILSSWDGSTAVSVRKSINDLVVSKIDSSEIVSL